MSKNVLFVAALAAVSSSLAAQTTVSLSASKDATLYEDPTGSLANGSGGGLFIGITGQPKIRRTLIQFDLSAIPAGSRILAATLTTNSTLSASSNPLDTTWHRAQADWSEGGSIAPGNGGGGTAALAGDATWVHTAFPTNNWNNLGGDFAATPSFSMQIEASGISTSTFSQGMVDDLQQWLDNPASNHGWLAKGDETLGSGTSTRIESRESGGGGVQLAVTYLTPGEVGGFGVGCPVGSGTMGVSLTGPATSGTTVSLNYTGTPASSIGATFYALSLDGANAPLFPGCSPFLPLNAILPGNLWTTDAQGVANDTFPVPPNSPGFLVVCQGAAIDASPLGFSLSNAGVMLTN